MEHCCKKMDYYADSTYEKDHEIIKYQPETRDYEFILHGKNYGAYQEIVHCPWCGKQLPKSLNEEWTAWVQDKLGLDDILYIEWKDLPEEYKTDKWWKKRGL